MTLYADLEVPPDADRATLSRAHRKAVKRHHPDAGGDRDKFERVQRAWLILSNPEKRERYDRTGETEERLDNELSELTGIIVGAFDRALDQALDPGRVDVIAKASGLLKTDIAQARDALNQGKAAKSKFAAAAKRLRFKGDGVDMLARVLHDRQRDIATRIAEIERAIGKLERARETLKLYGWDFERGGAAVYQVSIVDVFSALDAHRP